ncbi:hypothetical protein SJAG_05252 [Schizosaccharomyces japonicus yFS275]|uniref:Proteasome activator Blm10 middle HEAT repeats region domain-containing protein n=1 Tax=Schizosaccharomyces japonicus (strain yFS275 / FY16936) TaxID=402676 RepID=B6JZL2_SCHJY|nr:hypothetical protein SJAG_05252 [Schizosaccharomyces japonicus yFS275]EEB06980.2 hypothetical protein SJAG_05252 [Schizosaccharomyces japonicus yFS275]
MSALSKNRFTFDVLKQLPFECDSRLEQLSKLDFILSKLYIALTACNWVHILKWDNELDKWLQLGYRLPRKTHTTLVSIYYELAMSMNLTQLVDKHASARFRQLLDLPSCPDESCQGNVCTHCIDKRYLTVADLQLDWRLAFALLKKYFYPNQHYQSPVLPRFTCDAELIRAANAFFPAEETENVLNEVLPLFSLSHCEDAYIAIGMLSLLVPASPSSSDDFDLNPQTWLPTIFHLYNMLKKGDVCGTLLFDMFSRLAVGGLSDKYKYQFSEYGVFTQKQARTLFHYGLQLLHLSVRNGLSFTENTQSFAMEVAFDARGATVVSHLARWIVCSLSVKCEEAEDSILTLLDELFSLISQYFYPSVDGSNNVYLYQFLQELAYCFLERWTYENDEKVSIPKERRLTKFTKEKFVGILKPSMLYAIYSSAPYLSEMAQGALRALSILEPDVIVPCMLKRIYPALQSSLETHQTLISLESLITLAPIIAESKRYRPHIISLMELQLPGIDPNDSQKTRLVLHFVAVIAQCVSFCKIDENVDRNIFLQWLQMEIRNLDHTDYDNLTSKGDETVIDYDEIMSSAMNSFPEWMIRFEDRVFTLLENFPDGKDKKLIESYLLMALESLLKSMSDEWFNLALSRAANFVSTNVIHQSMDAVKGVCMAFSCVAPEKTWSALYPVISANIFFEIDENKAGLSRGSNADAILPRDRTLVWNLNILNTIIGSNATYFLRKEEELITLLDKLLRCRGFVSTLASSCMSQLVTRLISVFPTYSLKTQHLTTDEWGKPCKEGSFHMCWNIPFEQEIDLVVKVCNRYMMLCMDRLQHLIIDRKLTNATIEWVDEVNSYLERLGFMCSASAELFRIPDQEFVPESEYDEDNMYTADFEYVRSKSHCRWAITTQHRSIMDALRERLGSLLIELHRIMFDSVDSDVSILKNLVICENKFLSDYDYPVSLLSGRDYSNYLNPTLRYTNLLKFFDFVPQKQPYSAMLLSHNIYVNYQNHMCRSFLSRIPTSNERILIHNLTVPCCSQYEDIRRTACSALTDCVPFFRRIRLPVLQSLIGILKESKDVNVLQGAFEAIFFNPFLMNLVHRHWVFLSPFLSILIRLWSLDEPILRTIASDVFEYDMTTTVCYETYFPVYKHLYVPKVSSQSETERLRLWCRTEQQRQRDREAALKTRDEFVDLFPNAIGN